MARRKSSPSEAGEFVSKTENALAAQARAVLRGCSLWERSVGAELHIKSVAIYPPSTSRNGMWLVIGKAWSGGYKLVAFHRATDPLTAFAGFLQRAEEGKLIWKEDKFGSEG